MNLKSITFRCSAPQLRRLENAMLAQSTDNRTSFISKALDSFLTFVEQDENQGLNLFELVDKVDSLGSAANFSSQA
ncbi:MAG: hypothetical protein Q4F35_04825 [Akkermansia sp.]|nr:hypothetical protein [Akkermansia sp.]